MLDAKVLRVIDGDSIEVEAKMTIRLDFIDAPETRGIEKDLGIIAKEWLKAMLEGETVELDIKTQDRYGRFLSVVYKNDLNINGEMLRQNLAEVYSPKNHNNGKID